MATLKISVAKARIAKVVTLEELRDEVDMFTTVFIGNSQTKNINGKMVTPKRIQRSIVWEKY